MCLLMMRMIAKHLLLYIKSSGALTALRIWGGKGGQKPRIEACLFAILNIAAAKL